MYLSLVHYAHSISSEEAPEAEAPPEKSHNEDDDEEEMVEGEDLLTRIQRIQGRKGVLCEPAVPSQVRPSP